MAIKCFSVVSELVEESKVQFGSLYKLNEEKYNILKQYCKAIDVIVEEVDAETIDVEIDHETKNIVIEIGCFSFEVCSPDHVFYELVRRALSVRFKATSDDEMAVCFEFPTIWDM